MAIETFDCSTCPRLTENRRLHRSEAATQYCFDCPHAYRAGAFRALVSRLESRKLPIRSCSHTS